MICPACGSDNIDGNDRCENCLAPFRDLDVPQPDAAQGLARSVMENTLSQLEFEQTLTFTPDTPALEVARRMKEARLGCALVVDGGRLVGIFTEHDVLLRVNEHMQSLTARAGNGAADADNSRGASVVEGIPIQDVPFNDIPIEEMRAEEMLVEAESTTLKTAPEPRRDDHDLGCPVKDLMSANPESLDETDSVASALNKMAVGNYRHLPVRRSDASYSVASIKSVLKYIAREDW